MDLVWFVEWEIVGKLRKEEKEWERKMTNTRRF